MLSFILEAGMSTRVCRAVAALRMRVSISAMGSVIFMDGPPYHEGVTTRASAFVSFLVTLLPTRFCDAWQFTTQCTFTEADTAQAKFTHISSRSPTNFATAMLLHFETGLALRLHNH